MEEICRILWEKGVKLTEQHVLSPLGGGFIFQTG